MLERIKVTNFPAQNVSLFANSPGSTTTDEDHDKTKSPSSFPKNATAPAPERLRSKIFVSNTPEEYEPPVSTRLRRRKQRSKAARQHQQKQAPPKSRFAWICPAPPKYRLSRLDISNRGSFNDPHGSDYEFDFDPNTLDMMYDDHDPHDGGDDEDDDESNSSSSETAVSLKEQSPAARAGISLRRSNSNPNLLLTLGSSSKHRNAGLAASAPAHGGGPLGLPAPRRIAYTSGVLSGTAANTTIAKATTAKATTLATDDLRKSSMESIDLEPQQRDRFTKRSERQFGSVDEHVHLPSSDRHHSPVQYDLKASAKMLPLEKIRPTIGMNLAKTEICGAKVHIWDVGGKMQELWKRYYADADAVLFVWKLSREDALLHCQQQLRQQKTQTNRSDASEMADDIGESYIPVTAERQKAVLEMVRMSVPDDVPFLILGHLFQSHPPCNCEPDVLYSTSELLPHYHNPHQALFLANASTGQGIKSALEWLLVTAKRQKRLRERSIEAFIEK